VRLDPLKRRISGQTALLPHSIVNLGWPALLFR
jgi:hypothetical protein